jgi:fluoroacetyl-CoA thioesterase
MSFDDLKVGLLHQQRIEVDERLTVPAMADVFGSFVTMPPVFATAFLVAFTEWTCIEALRPYLEPSQRTVGVHVDLSHIAATPIDMAVTAEVELVAIEGKKLRFKVLVRDEVDVISQGHHDRAIIDFEKFLGRVERKRRSE